MVLSPNNMRFVVHSVGLQSLFAFRVREVIKFDPLKSSVIEREGKKIHCSKMQQ